MLKILTALAIAIVFNSGKEYDRSRFPENQSEGYVFPISPLASYHQGGPNQSGSSNQTPNWYARPEWWLCILGFPTLIVIGLQTGATMRAAKATERAVEIAGDTASHQLRAYVAVAIGNALYQQRRPDNPNGDLMFECRPLLINTGQTPAKNLRCKGRAAILPVPLPKGHHLPEGFDDEVGESIMAPQQQSNMFAVVEGFCLDNEVESIKEMGGPKGLYTWGLITYKDIFGKSHSTRFCHNVYWIGDEIRGLYVPGRNDAD